MPGSRLLTRYPYNPVPEHGKLTVANLVTDATRTTGTEGDGLAIGSGAGTWPAATNLNPYGRLTTDKAVIGAGDVTIADTVENPLFGSAHSRVTAVACTVNNGMRTAYASRWAVTGGATYTVGAQYKRTSGSFTAAATLYVNWYDGAGSYLSTSSTVSLTGMGTSNWSRITATVTAHASAATCTPYWVSLGAGQTVTIDVTGMTFVAGSIDIPYIETNGGTASRSAGRIQGPSSVLSATQGWFIARIRAGFGAAGPGYAPRLFAWGDGTDDTLELQYSPGWRVLSDATGGAAAQTQTVTDAGLAIDDNRTILGGWTASEVNVSKGAAWGAPTSRTEIPTISAATFDIGSSSAYLATREFACSFYWVAAGQGPYTVLDPVSIDSWGNNRPLPHQFPRSADLRFLAHFYGDGTQYRYRAA